MSTPGYMQYVLAGKKKSSKKRKAVPSDSDSPAPVQTVLPTLAVVATSSTPTPAPKLSSSAASMPNVVILEAGELWNKGVSPGLLAAIRPPKEFGQGAPMSVGDETVLNELRDNVLRFASLADSFKRLSVRYAKSISSNSTLASDVEKAKKERDDLSSRVQGLETKVSKLTSGLELSKAEVDQASQKAKEKEEELKEKEVELQAKDGKISELEKKYDDLPAALSTAVSESFENALAQARVLNPDLVTEGMSFTNTVKDGEIIQCAPEVNAGDDEDEDNGEEAEVTSPKARSGEASGVRGGEGSAALGD